MNWRNNLAILGLMAGLLIGCSTVVPDPVRVSAPSWDGTNQNSGLICLTTNGTAIITPHARDRYNALALRYGTNFAPPLQFDSGVREVTCSSNGAFAGTLYEIDNEHLAKFAIMNRWRKENKP